MADVEAARKPAKPFALEIPKADRRRRLPSRTRRAPAATLVLSTLIIAAGTAVLLLRRPPRHCGARRRL